MKYDISKKDMAWYSDQLLIFQVDSVYIKWVIVADNSPASLISVLPVLVYLHKWSNKEGHQK